VRLSVVLCAVALVASAACAGAQKVSTPEPLTPRPLAAYATRRVIVVPTHYLRPADTLGWASRISDSRDYLANVDAEIAFALGERGIKNRWVFPPALAESAKRNTTFAPDPYDLAAQWLRPPMAKAPEQLLEPLASELRSLVALHEDARYVLFPVEIRFAPAGGGQGRAVLRVAVLDARMSRITWMGDVLSDPSAAFSPALAASVAGHLADLVAAP
jgi:hypothetical protein